MKETTPVKHFNSGRVLAAQLPFPEGTRVGNLLFLSGLLGTLPGRLELAPGGLAAETRQALFNVRTILQAQGLDLHHLVRCTVMLADMAEWPEFNRVYSDFFGDQQLPARSTFGCNGLALGARVEIECLAAA